MNLESLNFYVDALNVHRNANKSDDAFVYKLTQLYMMDQVERDVFQMMLNIIKGVEPKSESPLTSVQAPIFATLPPTVVYSGNGGCGSSNTSSRSHSGRC